MKSKLNKLRRLITYKLYRPLLFRVYHPTSRFLRYTVYSKTRIFLKYRIYHKARIFITYKVCLKAKVLYRIALWRWLSRKLHLKNFPTRI